MKFMEMIHPVNSDSAWLNYPHHLRLRAEFNYFRARLKKLR